MSYWAIVYFVITVIAAFMGFSGVAVAFAGVAKILFFVFLVIFILTFVFGLIESSKPSTFGK